MPASITIEQKVNANVAFTTMAGNPALVDGIPVWESTDPNVMTVEPAADGMSAFAVSQGLGMATMRCVADADLGEGVVHITLQDDIEVTAAGAAAGVLGFETPILK